MSAYQPTLREAQEHSAAVERIVANAYRAMPIEWQEDRYGPNPPRVFADGYMIHQKGRRWLSVHWPMSRIERRCDDCGGVLLAARDAGGRGFWYDQRWMQGDPAVRDPRSGGYYRGRHACMPCFNRARAHVRKAQQINENRLLIRRIQREISRVAA